MLVFSGNRVDEFKKSIERLISKDMENPERKVDRFVIYIRDTDGVYHAFGSHYDGNEEFTKEVTGE